MNCSKAMPVSRAMLLVVVLTVQMGALGQEGVGQPSSHVKPGSPQSQVNGGNGNPNVSGDANQTGTVQPQPQNAQGKPLTTVSGTISDALCPHNHYVVSNASPTECTRYCIAHGSSYILVSGDKVYTLHNQPRRSLIELSGKQARVTGWLVDPTTIEVKEVTGSGTAAGK
jgi:hypothetical protein